LRENLRKGDNDAIEALITDEILEHFAVVARWDDVADVLISRYQGVAHRLVTYLAAQSISEDPSTLGKWCEVARAVTRAT
jgi:hypothetical protein